MEKMRREEMTGEEVTSEEMADAEITGEEVACDAITCDVIRDLLPLYCDQVCSRDSKKLVSRHLEGCRECCGLLQKMRKECVLPGKEEQAHETIVKDMAASWRKGLKRSFLKGALIMLCACAVAAGGWLALTRLIMVGVPAERMEIAVERVTERYVEISLRANDGKKVNSSSTQVTDDGKCYIILERGLLAAENGGGEDWKSTLTISRKGRLESGETVPVTEIYYGAGKDRVLIWKEDMGQE